MGECDWELKRSCIGVGVVSGSKVACFPVAGVGDDQPREQQ